MAIGCRYRIAKRILDGQSIIGYQVVGTDGSEARLSKQDVIRLAQAGLLTNATYNKSTQSLSGLGYTDLRTIESVQYSDIMKSRKSVTTENKSQSNHDKAKEYMDYYDKLNREQPFSFELLSKDRVRLTKANDRTNDREVVIPSFVTEILTRDQAHYYDMEPPFKRCKFSSVSWDNPKKAISLQGVFSEMQSKSLSIRLSHPEYVTDTSEMFYMCEQAEYIDISGLNTVNVQDMHGMFKVCSRLKNIDLSGLNTAKVTDMSEMFNWCASLEALDLRAFNTSNVKDMHSMFDRCMALKQLNVGSFNTSSVLYMQAMFNQCTSIEELDISNFDTSNVRDISTMFYGCRNLARLKHRINIQMASQTYNMFDDCDNLPVAVKNSLAS